MAMYEGLAALYDRLTDDFDYPKWADYYLALLKRAGVTPGSVCEAGCGTGSISVELAARGLRVTGVDLSREMLEVAADKARRAGRQVMFVCQDMCLLKLPRPVDALIAPCDGVNYLTTPAKLRAFFRAAREAVRPGGALAFDISSRHKLEEEMGNAFFGEEREDAAYLWSNSLDVQKHLVTMDLTFFVREKGGLYRRFQETHLQRAHEPGEIRAALEECGFSGVEVFGDQTFLPPGPEERRLHFLARRP